MGRKVMHRKNSTNAAERYFCQRSIEYTLRPASKMLANRKGGRGEGRRRKRRGEAAAAATGKKRGE